MKTNLVPSLITAFAAVARHGLVIACLAAAPVRAVVPDQAIADLVIGQPPTDASHFISPHVAIDPASGKLFVSDDRLNRILRFDSAAAMTNGAAAEAVLGQDDFAGIEPGVGANRLNGPTDLCVDNQGRLWVSDSGNHRVLCFTNAATLPNGASAMRVLGQVNFLNNGWSASASTFTIPRGLACDSAGRLYVADSGNHRVLRFDDAANLPNGGSASCVLGQTNFTDHAWASSGATRMASPIAVALAPNPVFPSKPYLWVADTENDRVLLFVDPAHLASGSAAIKVLGQTNFTSYHFSYSASGTLAPLALATDYSGHLYVSDAQNRILRFDNATSKASGAPADGILGQTSFTERAKGSGPGEVNFPHSLALDANGRLWIADRYNNRVLRHEQAHMKANGADADGVLGANSATTDLSRKFRPGGMAIDPVSGKLFVADDYRHRVLRFANVLSLTNDSGAEAVFGQADFSGDSSGTAGDRMKSPTDVAVDHLGNLWVADAGNNRVLRFNNASQRASGVSADGVLGQANFTTGASQSVTAGSIYNPRALAVGNGGELWVGNNYRVLRFDNAAAKGNGANADGVLGQPDFVNTANDVDAFHTRGDGLVMDSAGTLWVNDSTRRRILRFENAAAKINGAAADGVLGQPDFVSSNDNGASPDGISYSAMIVEAGGRFWATDGNHNRVLRWEHAAARPNGADADGVIGQPDFGFSGSGLGLDRLLSPRGIVRDAAGHLWVSDSNNERLLRFAPVTPRLALAEKNPSTLALTCEGVVRNVQYERQFTTNFLSWQSDGSTSAPVNGTMIIDIPKPADAMRAYRLLEN